MPAPEPRPLLLVDVDGVLSLFGPGVDPSTCTPALVEGIPHLLSRRAATLLARLAATYDCVWCTGWEDRADGHLPHLLGLPAGWPHLVFSDRPQDDAHWKLAAIDGRAEQIYGSKAARAVLMNLIVARPANVPGPVAASWNHATATCPGWHATLPEVTDWRPQMPAVPTTIAWAQHDRLLLAGRQAPRARRWLPEARHTILEGCGHVPMWDDPEQVARAILDGRA